MAALTLAEEFALLCYSDSGSAELGSPALDYGLAGALLLELALARRVEVIDGRLAVTDPTPTGHPLPDAALHRIGGDDKRRKPRDWIGKLSQSLRERVLDGLVRDGVLRREEDRVLWVFPRTRFPSPTGAEPAAETAARQRLRAAVGTDGPVEPRTAALCALIEAVELDRKVFHELPRDRVKGRLAEISAGDWASAATKGAIQEMQAAVMVAITVSTITTTSSGN